MRRGDAIETLLECFDRVVVGDLVGEIADQALNIDLAQQRRRFTHRYRTRPETFEPQSEAGERFGVHCQPLDVVGGQVDDFGQKQHLGGQGPRMHRRLQRLVDQALMGRMLVDDDQRILRLSDDVVAMDLGAGGAKRVGER